MAELDIGQHCQVEHCRQRDFLPFVCDGCSGIFCLEHRSKESHGCPEVTIINDRLKTDTHKSFPCSFKDCTERELVAVLCPYCEKNFCLRHRHQSDHECEKLEIPKPRMAATQKLVKDIIDSKTKETASKRRKGAKNSETAAKVALMKLKMHADGDKSLPQKMADPWQECMDYAVTLARQAGEVVREALKNEMNVMIKSSPADLVTATDQKVEKMLIASIKEKYPSHSFIGEESVAAGEKSTLTNNPTWIIDPIDGTTNFVHRFPFVAVSIGFVVNKKMEFGVVYSCIEDKMYTGRKGKGAFCNGQKLQVSQQEDITKSLLVTELGSSRTPETVKIILSNMEKLLCIPVHGIRGVGTAAVNMCLVATGGADAYYEMGIHCWDMAGAGIIVTEAGGVLMDVTGGPFDLMSRRIIAASTRALAERIAKEIQIVPFQRDDED
uniref:Inositol monophosphatase 1 n=1 Tax=Oryctolagus cuniculus TaxID=9986 RepID=G1T7L5_RABIT